MALVKLSSIGIDGIVRPGPTTTVGVDVFYKIVSHADFTTVSVVDSGGNPMGGDIDLILHPSTLVEDGL